VNCSIDSETSVLPVPVVSALLSSLSAVVQYCQWSDELNEVSPALTQFNSLSDATTSGLSTLRKDHQELPEFQVTLAPGTDWPLWLVSAWKCKQIGVRKQKFLQFAAISSSIQLYLM
jgi:hypothetical protein